MVRARANTRQVSDRSASEVVPDAIALRGTGFVRGDGRVTEENA